MWVIKLPGFRLPPNKEQTARGWRGAKAYWCVCSCGTERLVYAPSIDLGLSRDCGCTRRAKSSAWCTSGAPAITHGLSKHEHFPRWKGMMERCHNPDSTSYPDYGGRGIQVCDEWQNLAVFLRWMDDNLGPCPPDRSLDRIDNDGPYAPWNVHWATFSEQMKNRRLLPRDQFGRFTHAC